MKHTFQVMKINVLLIFLFSSLCPKAKTIDFDERYGGNSSLSLIEKVNNAIKESKNGDVLLFNGESYDFEGKSLTINKSITISGKTASFDPNKIGAQNVSSAFRNLQRISLRANHIKFKHIDIRAKDGVGYFIFATHPDKKLNIQYKGILFENSILQNASVLVYGGNGVGVTFKNLSCYDFNRGAFLNDRRIDNNYSNKMHFEKCYFKPNQSTLYFDTRAISFDAGNDEHPITWNLFNTTIQDNVFDGAGVAFSKCRNAVVTNNHFKGYSMWIDMVHMEEFTNNIKVTNNQFEFVKPARCFYIDREGQPCHHVTITNNKFVGKIGWVISSYSPHHLTFENNDFTEASAHKSNGLMFDFNYTHRESHFTALLPITDLIVRNNPGLDNKERFGKIAFTETKWNKSNVIEGYAEEKIVKTVVKQNPKSLIESGKIFRIQCMDNKRFMASTNDSKIVLSKKRRDKTDWWTIDYTYPYTYNIINVGTGNCLEVHRGYNLADRRRDPVPTVYAEQVDSYEDKPKPSFFLRKIEENGKVHFEILPGSNEQKSRLVEKDGFVEMEFATNKEAIPATDHGKWVLVERN